MISIVDFAAYVPDRVVNNEFLSRLTGRGADWFERVTGILERRRASPGQTINDLATAAVRGLAARQADSLPQVDLIIGCTYTPYDSIGTLAHMLQRELGIETARAFTLSSACSSMVNALEIAAVMLKSGNSRKTLIVGAEHNSRHADDKDDRAGHLWGDGAAALLVGTTHQDDRREFTLLDVVTEGRATLGEGPEAITLLTHKGQIEMRDGRSVFAIACRELERVSRLILARNGLTAADIALLCPHQANQRIIDHVAEALDVCAMKVASTIRRYGNTGCASAFITLVDYGQRLKSGDLVLVPVFGGGYSVGAALLRRC